MLYTLEINKYHTLYTPIDHKPKYMDETLLFINEYLTFYSYLIKLDIRQSRDIYFYYVIIDNCELYPKLIKLETKDKSIHEIAIV